MIEFYDTSSLMEKIPNGYFQISSITLKELENIKTSSTKDFDSKLKARHISNWLSEHLDQFKCIRYYPSMLSNHPGFYGAVDNDTKILATAYSISLKEENLTFQTNDNNLFLFSTELGLTTQKIKLEEDTQNGIFEISLNDEEMAKYYSNLRCNVFNLYIGQQAIIKNAEGEVVDRACWTGEEMRPLRYDDFTSGAFGRLKPKRDDPYQACMFDSLSHNQVNLITGPAGSGKSLISLAYLFSLLDKTIDRIVVFCNPIIVRNAGKIGFVPGDTNQKLLTTQMGNILSSKLGDLMAVEGLIAEGKLVLVPVGDSRGYEVPPSSAVYITEGQNYNIDLLRLLLQRCGDDTIVIVEGDALEQVDNVEYAGDNSGIRAMSKAFKGDEQFGQVELKNIYRSHTGQLADKMGRDE